MDEYLEKAIEWTGCDNAEIICSKDNDTWKLIVCAYTDDDGYCHCWLLRIWKSFFNGELMLSVDYEDTTRMEDSDAHMSALGRAIARVL
jgi:hypothetical protein